jgi:formate/nitrite transporter FocA (FNT family)
MPETEPRQGQAILSLNAYSPAEIQEAIEKVGVTKVDMPFLPCFMLGVVAGGSIGVGALYYTIVSSDAELSFAITRLLGGLVFSLGLAPGTGRWSRAFHRQQPDRHGLGQWQGLDGAHAAQLGDRLPWQSCWCTGTRRPGRPVATSRDEQRTSRSGGDRHGKRQDPADFVTLFFKGILCNVLVCMAVWLAYAGRSVTDKIVGLVLPVSAFVAAGFEHCIANLYFLPLAWLIVHTGASSANIDVSAITVTGIVHNLVPVTLGNIVGGAGLVGFVYWAIYRRGMPQG